MYLRKCYVHPERNDFLYLEFGDKNIKFADKDIKFRDKDINLKNEAMKLKACSSEEASHWLQKILEAMAVDNSPMS